MKPARAPFHRNIVLLSIISFLNDIGGETIKKIIPLFLSDILGAPLTIIGLIEGIGDAIPFICQPISGYISDRLAKRKIFVLLGQVLRSQVLWLTVVASWPQLLIVRFIDRSGKGIQNAPRDALVSESSEKRHMGRSFGLNRMLDNAGSVVGMTLAALILFTLKDSSKLTLGLFRSLVLFAAIPSITAAIIILFFVKDIKGKKATRHRVIHFGVLKGKYLLFLFCSAIFTLGNSSDAFIVLKAQKEGIGLPVVFLLVALYSFVTAIFGLFFSALSDTKGRKVMLTSGWIAYAIAYFFLARATSFNNFGLLILLYGIYGALTEGSARALISDLVPEEVKGTAFGIYFWVVGAMLLPASFIAGLLWQMISPEATFYFGAFMAGAAAITLALFL
jgi:MFS family permease